MTTLCICDAIGLLGEDLPDWAVSRSGGPPRAPRTSPLDAAGKASIFDPESTSTASDVPQPDFHPL